jgi:hypothetical protein
MLGAKLPNRKKRKIETTTTAAEGEEGEIARPEV